MLFLGAFIYSNRETMSSGCYVIILHMALFFLVHFHHIELPATIPLSLSLQEAAVTWLLESQVRTATPPNHPLLILSVRAAYNCETLLSQYGLPLKFHSTLDKMTQKRKINETVFEKAHNFGLK